MRKIINILLVLSAGAIIIYHRMYESIEHDLIFLPLLVFSLVMLAFYRRIHQQTHFHILAILIILLYTMLMNGFVAETKIEDFVIVSLAGLTLSFFVVSLVVRFGKVIDRNIKKRMNKLVFVYAVWILLFHSPFTNFLVVFITDFSGPIPDHIETALYYFWLLSDLGFILVFLSQLYYVYLIDDELIYRRQKMNQRYNEELKEKENKKDIFGYRKDFYETEY